MKIFDSLEENGIFTIKSEDINKKWFKFMLVDLV